MLQALQLIQYLKRMQISFLLSSDVFLYVGHDSHTTMCF